MEEIKINDYIRTIDGYIRKVTQVNKKGTYEGICYGAYSVDKPYKNSQGISAKKIKSHSKDIINLIECGDYVNGKKVVCFRNTDCDYDIGTGYNDEFGVYYGYDKEQIKDVVTKEQFNQMKYIVGDE